MVGYGDTQEEVDANHDENLRKLRDSWKSQPQAEQQEDEFEKIQS